MKLIRGIHNLNKVFRGCVLTIGNFDGVHRGHQVLLQKLCKEGKTRKLPAVVMIFEPHPLELFTGKRAPARLTQLRDKLFYLSKYDVYYILCIRFNHHFATITAQNFISDLLVKRLNVQFLTVGEDFRFGAGRQGDFLLLQESGLKYGFDVASTVIFSEDKVRISSTGVRLALANDRLDIAENLLGHPFSISGRVIHGNSLGRTIGFPTANISLRRRITPVPVKGVYAVDVFGLNNKPLPGIANIGIRPTVLGIQQQLEVHLLDVVVDIYGYYINVVLRKKIRNEQYFSSFKKLKLQIENDELIARKFFELSNSSSIPRRILNTESRI